MSSTSQTLSNIKQNFQSFLKSIFVNHEVQLCELLASPAIYTIAIKSSCAPQIGSKYSHKFEKLHNKRNQKTLSKNPHH